MTTTTLGLGRSIATVRVEPAAAAVDQEMHGLAWERRHDAALRRHHGDQEVTSRPRPGVAEAATVPEDVASVVEGGAERQVRRSPVDDLHRPVEGEHDGRA